MKTTFENLGIKDIAESERPRERLYKYGASAMSNAELLAILISSGTKEESALSLAYRLLASEKNDISSFSNYIAQEYCAVKGIGEATSCRIAAAVEFGKRVCLAPKKRVHLDEPAMLAEYLGDMRNFQKEILRIAMFNVKTELIKTADITMGGIAGTSASAREVFAEAIRAGASAIVLIHNHPSGDPTPSREDREVTENMVSAGRILGIKVMDHIIIGDGVYCSFKEEGIL
ncbi:MAG: DNA repair protein RadC [Firmicutes bacterium]|nr:DNA repair protein RadC [Bacillota bacterium]